MDNTKGPIEKVEGANLGTFAGVFTPSILTILGIILFLRLGYVVGSAGLGRALIIIGLANAISILTSISLSAIATNLRVKGGGDYYLISRTLGVQFGGAIGIVLFLAQSVSVAFYCIGFGEAVGAILNRSDPFFAQFIAAIAVSFLFILAWMGADWATRFQYLVMCLLFLALVSFFSGAFIRWDGSLIVVNWASPVSGPPFWVIFAIFFPAVTGFTQGVSMSGDLEDPGKSLPLGTFMAVGVSIAVYFAVALLFAGTLSNEVLSSDYNAMKRVARVNFLIDSGVIAATLSSAMASFLGAPRILQSLAGDRIFPFLLPFAKGSGPISNPRRGVLLTSGIAFTTIALGNLNVIAPIVSMFFLISYGLLNYATFYEARSLSPAFRPRFKWFHPNLSLLGFLACLGTMMAIDFRAGAIALSLLFAIFQYLKRTAGPSRWADSRRSYNLQQVRSHLMEAAGEPEHPRDWRPQILAFSRDPERRIQLLKFASWLHGGSGMVTAVEVLEGEGVKMLKIREEAEREISKEIVENDLEAFPLAIFSKTVESGIESLIQSFGIGPVRANTALVNWREVSSEGVKGLRDLRYGRNLRTAFRLGCNLVILSSTGEDWKRLEQVPPESRRIDLWWWNDASSRLMLLFAYLVMRHHDWSGSKLRVLAACYEHSSDENLEEMRNILDEARISGEVELIAGADGESVQSLSSDASLVFIPFRLKAWEILDPFGSPPRKLLSSLPVTSIVLAAEDIDLDAEPEEGRAGEMASASDALEDALKRAKDADKEALDAEQEAEKAFNMLIDATYVEKRAPEEIRKLEAAARHARRLETEAARKTAKAQAKVEIAKKDAERAGVTIKEEKEGHD